MCSFLGGFLLDYLPSFLPSFSTITKAMLLT